MFIHANPAPNSCLCSSHLFLLSLCLSQATNSDQHPLLDWAAPERPPAVARQGAHTNGLPQHPLLQRLLGKPFIHPFPVHHIFCQWLKTQTVRRQERLHKYRKMANPPCPPFSQSSIYYVVLPPHQLSVALFINMFVAKGDKCINAVPC